MESTCFVKLQERDRGLYPMHCSNTTEWMWTQLQKLFVIQHWTCIPYIFTKLSRLTFLERMFYYILKIKYVCMTFLSAVSYQGTGVQRTLLTLQKNILNRKLWIQKKILMQFECSGRLLVLLSKKHMWNKSTILSP